MKPCFVVVFIFFIGLSTSAQNNIGVLFQPTLDFMRSCSYTSNYSVGLRTNIKLYQKLLLSTELGYGHQMYDLTKYDGPIFMYGSYPIYFESKTIRIDCHLRYNIIDNKKNISFYGLMGAVQNTNLYEKTDYKEFVIVGEKIRFFNSLLITGIGFEYTIKEIALSIEPIFCEQIWRNWKTSYCATCNVVCPYRYRFGINIGLNYKWKNNSTRDV